MKDSLKEKEDLRNSNKSDSEMICDVIWDNTDLTEVPHRWVYIEKDKADIGFCC